MQWNTGTSIDAIRVLADGSSPDKTPWAVVPTATEDFQAASNGSGYLFAWTATGADSGDIYADHVSPDGNVAPPTPVAVKPGQQIIARVASDGDGYLVTWQDPADRNVMGMRFDGSGAPMDQTGFPIANDDGYVADFDGLRYLVGWSTFAEEQQQPPYGTLHATRVTPGGNILDPSGFGTIRREPCGLPVRRAERALPSAARRHSSTCARCGSRKRPTRAAWPRPRRVPTLDRATPAPRRRAPTLRTPTHPTPRQPTREPAAPRRARTTAAAAARPPAPPGSRMKRPCCCCCSGRASRSGSESSALFGSIARSGRRETYGSIKRSNPPYDILNPAVPSHSSSSPPGRSTPSRVQSRSRQVLTSFS